MIFKDRRDAAIRLASVLEKYRNGIETVVIGLPRGGVETAFFIAEELNLPLDIVIPRKIGSSFDPEFAIGAVSEEGVFFPTDGASDVTEDYLRTEIDKELKESKRRSKEYREERVPIDLSEKTVLLVDDGLATGSTMEAAISSVRKKGAKKIVVVVPVLPADQVNRELGDEIIYLVAPEDFKAVGQFYEKFDQVSDERVKEIMRLKR